MDQTLFEIQAGIFLVFKDEMMWHEIITHFDFRDLNKK